MTICIYIRAHETRAKKLTEESPRLSNLHFNHWDTIISFVTRVSGTSSLLLTCIYAAEKFHVLETDAGHSLEARVSHSLVRWLEARV